MLKQITYQFFMRHTYSPIYFHMILKKSQAPAGKKISVVERKYVMMKEKQKGY